MATGKVFQGGKQVGTVDTEDPAFQYKQAQSAAASRFGSWSPEYAAEYKRKQMERFGREVGAAQGMLEGMIEGDTSQALAQQRLGLGQSAQQQAITAASGNPLAQRAGMYGGAQQAFGVAQQGAAGRSQEIGQGRQALLGSQLQQMGYAGQLEALDFQRRAMQEEARRQYAERELKKRMQMQAENEAARAGMINTFTSVLPFVGDLVQSGIEGAQG